MANFVWPGRLALCQWDYLRSIGMGDRHGPLDSNIIPPASADAASHEVSADMG